MKKLFTFFLALVASVSAIYAQSGSCGDNLTWTLSNGTLTISGTDAMADYISSPMPWYNYREVIKSVIIAEGVTSIGSGAFSDCSSLSSITIPNSVTSIGDNAFSDCSSLSSITIPNSVISIGIWGFGGCSSLTSVTIGSGVMSIGIQAFSYCSSLTSVDVANDNPNYCSIDGVLFSKDKTTLIQYPIGNHRTKYTINNTVTNIGREAFLGCSLTSITIPNSVMSIGASAFFECTALTSVTFEGSTPPSIDRDVFYNTNNCPIYVPSGRKEVYVAALNVNNTIDESRVIEKTVIPQNLGQKTIAEFLALKNPIDTCILTGVVANIVMDSNDPTQYNEYGNFDIVDETGTLYVYGLLTLEGQTKQFRTMGVDAGDTLTVMATYNEYNSKPQAKNAIFVSLKEGNGSAPVETADVVFTAVDFAGQGVTGTGGPVSATKDSVIFTCNKGYGSKYDVRCYKGSTVTIASTTEQIAKIEFDFDTISGTSYDGGLDPVTVVNAKEWTVTLSSQTRMNKISIYFSTAEAVGYDTVTVAEALAMGNALADNAETDTIVVEGYAVNVTPYDITFGIQQFYLADDAASTTSDLMVFRAKPTKNGAAYPVLAGDKVQLKGIIKKYVVKEGDEPIIEVMYPSVTFVTEVAGNRTLATTTEITVTKALEIGAALSEGAITDDTYDIVGYVTQIDDNSFNTSYKNMVFWIADENNGAATNAAGAFEVYRGKPTQELKVGDKVSVETKIQNYKGTIISVSSVPVTLLQAGTSETSADVVFDKNDFAGQGVASTGGPVSAEKNGVTFTCDKGYGDGYYGVRCYTGSTVTITSATEQIAKIEFDLATVSGTSYDGGLEPVTVVNAKEWTVALSSQARMNKISIYFGTAEAMKIDTVTVAEALAIGEALADNSYSNKKYAVVGYVASAKVFEEKYEGAQTFYMSDDATATYGEFTAYNCNVAAPGVVPGNYVAVVGKIQKYVGNSGLTTIEITGGEVVKNPFWFQHTIKGVANIEEGGMFRINSTPIHYCHEITAIPNYGYHFVQWSDGSTENPRSFILTQDTIFTAIYAPNSYSIQTQSNYTEWGATKGDTTVLYLDSATIQAVPNYGYHFTKWNDGNTDNPRLLQVTEHATYTAIFNKNIYAISLSCNEEQGSVKGAKTAEYLDMVTVFATPNVGYYFVQWSDGIAENPRTLELTQDTSLTAEFAQSFSGQCGDNLYWEFIDDNLYITGNGTMYNYIQNKAPWTLFVSSIKSLSVSESTTSIGKYAFSNCSSLTSITIPNSVTSIESGAFYGCSNITSVTWNAKNCNSYNFGSQVTSFEFGNEVEVIPSSLCKGMEKLTSVTIPNSVKTIGASTFKGCIRLGKVSLGKNWKLLEQMLLQNVHASTTYMYMPLILHSLKNLHLPTTMCMYIFHANTNAITHWMLFGVNSNS